MNWFLSAALLIVLAFNVWLIGLYIQQLFCVPAQQPPLKRPWQWWLRFSPAQVPRVNPVLWHAKRIFSGWMVA